LSKSTESIGKKKRPKLLKSVFYNSKASNLKSRNDGNRAVRVLQMIPKRIVTYRKGLGDIPYRSKHVLPAKLARKLSKR
jgi:hypothetical protein